MQPTLTTPEPLLWARVLRVGVGVGLRRVRYAPNRFPRRFDVMPRMVCVLVWGSSLPTASETQHLLKEKHCVEQIEPEFR
jgi:hypothetical protein